MCTKSTEDLLYCKVKGQPAIRVDLSKQIVEIKAHKLTGKNRPTRHQIAIQSFRNERQLPPMMYYYMGGWNTQRVEEKLCAWGGIRVGFKPSAKGDAKGARWYFKDRDTLVRAIALMADEGLWPEFLQKCETVEHNEEEHLARCGEIKTLREFSQNSKRPNGRRNTCKDCDIRFTQERNERKAAGLMKPSKKRKSAKVNQLSLGWGGNGVPQVDTRANAAKIAEIKQRKKDEIERHKVVMAELDLEEAIHERLPDKISKGEIPFEGIWERSKLKV